jgi:hypothetical protein
MCRGGLIPSLIWLIDISIRALHGGRVPQVDQISLIVHRYRAFYVVVIAILKNGIHLEAEIVMHRFRVCRTFVVLVLVATMPIGCSALRRKPGRNASQTSSAATFVPTDRAEMAQADAADTAVREVVQQTCPVTGERLGSMGSPISVTVGGKTIQVCCQGCVAAVEKNPDRYLKIAANERALSDSAASRIEGLYGTPPIANSPGQSTYNRPFADDHSSQSSGGHHH